MCELNPFPPAKGFLIFAAELENPVLSSSLNLVDPNSRMFPVPAVPQHTHLHKLLYLACPLASFNHKVPFMQSPLATLGFMLTPIVMPVRRCLIFVLMVFVRKFVQRILYLLCFKRNVHKIRIIFKNWRCLGSALILAV